MGSQEGVGGFALGLGVGWGFWFVFEDIREASGCEGAGFGFDDFDACLGDAFDGGGGLLVGFGFEQVGELGEGELVEAAKVEGGD